jgi:hypothetical protein
MFRASLRQAVWRGPPSVHVPVVYLRPSEFDDRPQQMQWLCERHSVPAALATATQSHDRRDRRIGGIADVVQRQLITVDQERAGVEQHALLV